MQFARKLQSIITLTVIFVTLSISACSMRLMYNNLGWIIPLYIDDYVSLTDHQEALSDKAISQFLKWHRTQELPRYERFIVALKDAQTTPMSQQQVLLFFDDAESLFFELLTESMPSLLEMSALLNEKQIGEINQALINDLSERKSKYGNKSENQRRTFWQEKMNDSVDDWLGSVTDEQVKIIQLWSATRKNTTKDWLISRNSWRLKFIEILNNRQSANFSQDMKTFLLHPQSIYSDSYRRDILVNRQQLAQLVADLSTTFTLVQREHFQDKLSELIDDLRALRDQ